MLEVGPIHGDISYHANDYRLVSDRFQGIIYKDQILEIPVRLIPNTGLVFELAGGEEMIAATLTHPATGTGTELQLERVVPEFLSCRGPAFSGHLGHAFDIAPGRWLLRVTTAKGTVYQKELVLPVDQHTHLILEPGP